MNERVAANSLLVSGATSQALTVVFVYQTFSRRDLVRRRLLRSKEVIKGTFPSMVDSDVVL